MDAVTALERALEFARQRQAAPGALAGAAEFPLDVARFEAAWAEYRVRLDALASLASPGFAAQMAAAAHPVALLGYVAAMLLNPNNHDVRHGGATLAMEREVVAELAGMFGFPASAGGHLTSGGATANLDGIWSCRQRHPRGAIAFSEDAHFVHQRICRLIGAEAIVIPCDRRGRIEVARLEDLLRQGRVGCVVLSAGTAALGAVDPIDEVVALRRIYSFSIHVDASYGGFFALLKDDPEAPIPARAFAAIAACDSVAVDPHKHGYQPYGCGCSLFRDGAAGLFAQSSPYTDAAARSGFECSRPGAAAGALWLTLRCLPLCGGEGFGPILRACLDAARRLAARLDRSESLALHLPPELGIVAFLPRVRGGAAIGAASRALLATAQAEGLSLSILRTDAARLAGNGADVAAADGPVDILRMVLMKPEQRDFVPTMVAALERLAGSAGFGAPNPL